MGSKRSAISNEVTVEENIKKVWKMLYSLMGSGLHGYNGLGDADVPRSPSYGVLIYISQLIRFARVCSYVDDFNNRNLFLTAKL